MGQFEDSVIETTLLRWVTAAVCSAVLVTGLMGFLSWRTANEAAEDADWVTHTYAVKAAPALVDREQLVATNKSMRHARALLYRSPGH